MVLTSDCVAQGCHLPLRHEKLPRLLPVLRRNKAFMQVLNTRHTMLHRQAILLRASTEKVTQRDCELLEVLLVDRLILCCLLTMPAWTADCNAI